MDRGSINRIIGTQGTLAWFTLMVIVSQVVGVLALILLFVFLIHYRGGFEWHSDVSKQFNYHPLFMTLGMVFLYGDAILAYRVFRDVQKLSVKIVHASLLAFSLIFASVGLKAVFDSHNLAKPPKANMYSLHSWVGLVAVILFGLQWVSGFVAFLFPKLSGDLRQAYMPSHKFWGKVIFALAVAALFMGITEYGIFFSLYPGVAAPFQRNLINLFGLLIGAFAVLVLYIVGHPGYQRPPDYEVQHMPLPQ